MKIKLPDFSFEKKYTGLIAGIDEAGRGPLAGPVVAACVILPFDNYPPKLNDSKKLSPGLRAEIFASLNSSAKIGIGIIDEKIIDEINILNATKLAMTRAYEDLCAKYKLIPDMVLVDGNFIPKINSKAISIIKGDSLSLSIAAASVIAKETRDQIMINLDQEFPSYGWAKNKAYGTKFHLDKINEFGICKYHRKSFIPKKYVNR